MTLSIFPVVPHPMPAGLFALTRLGVAQFGRAFVSGTKGRKFKSSRRDQENMAKSGKQINGNTVVIGNANDRREAIGVLT